AWPWVPGGPLPGPWSSRPPGPASSPCLHPAFWRVWWRLCPSLWLAGRSGTSCGVDGNVSTDPQHPATPPRTPDMVDAELAELSPTVAARLPGPDEVTDQVAFQGALAAALAALPERQRVAVVLFDVEGYRHAEVAQVLGVPEGTVRSDVFHARRALRAALAAW